VIEVEFLEVGRRLTRISRERLWQAGGWDSWEEYCADLRMSPTSASKLARIYRLLIEEWRMSPAKLAEAGGWTVIAEFLPAVKDRRGAEHWLELACRMPRIDLRRTIHEETAGTDMLRCPHENCYYLKICRDCGLRVVEYEENIKLVKHKNYGENNQLVAGEAPQVEEAPVAA
jgi:hypothetical protein